MTQMIKSVLFSDCAAFLQKHDIRQGAIMNIGIDNLREINAIHGMHMGDEILDLFTQIIVGEVGEKNVFRLESSDEFIVILPKYHMAAEGKNLFVKIQKEVNEQCHKRSFYYTVSAGMVLFNGIRHEVEDIFSCAEFALNRAKENGKNRIFVYSIARFEEYGQKMELTRELRRAVEHQFAGFELYYQPLVSTEKKSMIGAEALLRWKNAKYPKANPGQFIPVLEQSGLINEVGKFIIEEAVKQQKEWDEISPGFTIHINLSYVQFQSGNLLEQLRYALEKYQVPAQHIVLEITESGFIGKDTRITRQLKSLKQMGFQLALDDFGTGYSNFAYLKDFELDVVKLDKEFITEAINSREGMRLLVQIVNTIHAIGMKVCLEGVEQPADLDRLLPYGPEIIQGYVFGKPVNAESFKEYFTRLDNQEYLHRITMDKKADMPVTYMVDAIREDDRKKAKSRKRGIAFMTVTIAVLLAVFILMGVGYGAHAKGILENLLQDNMQQQLSTAMEVLQSETEDAQQMARGLSAFVAESYQSVDENSYVKVVRCLVREHEQIGAAGVWLNPAILDANNLNYVYVYKENNSMNAVCYENISDYGSAVQEYYEQCRITGEEFITEPYMDPVLESEVITFVCPVYNAANGFMGCITVDFYLEDINRTVDTLRPEIGGYAILLDENKNYLCGSYEDYHDDDTFTDRLKNQKQGNFRYYWDKEYVIYFDTMENTGWKLLTCARYSKLYAPVRQTLLALACMISVVLAAASIVVIIMGKLFRKLNDADREKRRNINISQFRALSSSYYLILSVNLDTRKASVLYKSNKYDTMGADKEYFEQYIKEIGKYVSRENLERFMNLSSESNLRELHLQNVLREEIQMRFPALGDEIQWVEVSISPIDGTEGKEVLYMLRNIDVSRKKEQSALQANSQLVDRLRSVNEELFRVSVTDKMTGVYNREGLEYYTEPILKQAGEPGYKLFLLLADADCLKKVNDEWGHESGDKYISMVAEILQSVKPADLICARIGGDEFVLFGAMPEGQNPQEIVEAINHLVEQRQKEIVDGWEIGISAGYFWGKPDANKEYDDYSAIADHHMYKIKKAKKEREKE